MLSQNDPKEVDRNIKERLDAAGVAARAKKFDEAIAKCKEAWEAVPEPRHKWPSADWILQNLATAYSLKGDVDGALETYRSALQTPEGSRKSTIHLAIGRILFDRGETDAAYAHLKQAWDISEGRVFVDVPKKYRDFLRRAQPKSL